MDFELDEAQQDLHQRVLAFARDHLPPPTIAEERAGELDLDGWRKCAEFGLLGLPMPAEYGGLDVDVVAATAAMEALGYACRDSGLVFSLNAQLWSVQVPILLHGTQEQRDRYLPALTSGEMVAAYAMSETESGSDAFAMRTRAEKAGDDYVLNGSKTWCTNAPVASCFLVFAMTNPKAGFLGATAFLVDRDTLGLEVGPPIDKMGLKTSPMAEVYFDDCRIPATQRLGREGQGARIFHSAMAWERACLLGSNLGAMQWQLEQCIDYAKTRQQFGQAIGKNQSVANLIVDMKVRLEAARLLLYKVAWLKEQGRDGAMEAAIAKLFVSESWVQSSLDAVQVHGGYGYTTEAGVERSLRDAVGGRICSGTSEIQRNVIARYLGL